MTANKRQHAVPRFYLRFFADPRGFVHVLDSAGRRFRSRPENLAAAHNLYDIHDETARVMAADRVNQNIENWCAPRMAALSATTPPSCEHWTALWIIGANMLVRSRRTRDRLTGLLGRAATATETMAPILRAHPPSSQIEAALGFTEQNICDMVNPIRRATKVHHAVTVAAVDVVARELRQMGCRMLVAPEGAHFVTSDDPAVVIMNGRQTTFEMRPGFLREPALEFLLPLKPTLACYWSRAGSFQTEHVSEDEVLTINRFVHQAAYSQTYAAQEAELDRLVGRS